MEYCPVNRGDGLTRDCSRHKNGDRPPMIHKDMGCIFYFPPCKGSPVPRVPCKVRPLRGWPKENHPRRGCGIFFRQTLPDTGTGQSGRREIKNTGSRSRTCLTDKNTRVMKILNEEHFENVKRYAESIGDTSLQKCLDRLESWEENPDCPSEISLYYDHAPYSFGFTQRYPDGRTGIVGGLLYHGMPDRSFAVTLQPFHGWQIHT